MTLTLGWLSRMQRDLPRPKRAGEVFRVIFPNQSPPFITETAGVFKSVETFALVAWYFVDEQGCEKLRWVLPKDLRVAL